MTQATHLLAFGRFTDTARKVSFEVKIVNGGAEAAETLSLKHRSFLFLHYL